MMSLVGVVFSMFIVTVDVFMLERHCEPISIPMCKKLGYYSFTAMPNLLGHETQREAQHNLMSIIRIIPYGCSQHTKLFLCTVYAPMCNYMWKHSIGPCRPLCEHVKGGCEPVLLDLGFKWPSIINCSNFIEHNEIDSLCVIPDELDVKSTLSSRSDQDAGDLLDAASIRDNAVKNQDFSMVGPNDNSSMDTLNTLCGTHRNSYKKYVYSNRSEGPICKLRCNSSDLYTHQDKKFAEKFIGVFSGICLLLTSFSVLTFFVSEWPDIMDRQVVLIAFCYMCYTVAFVFRIVVGSDVIICQVDRYTNISVVLTNGLANSKCVLIFFLLYYFRTAWCLWWIVLSFNWFLVVGLGWKKETLLNFIIYFHVFTWGFPAVISIIIILLRGVDTDELTGLCNVGNRDSNYLLMFVIVPSVVYLLLVISFVVIGLILFRKRCLKQLECHIDSGQVKIMIIVFVFTLAYLSEVLSRFCEYLHTRDTLATQPSMPADISTAMFQYVCILLPGIAIGSTVTSNIVQSWNFCHRQHSSTSA